MNRTRKSSKISTLICLKLFQTPMHLAAIFRDKMDTLEASTEQTCLEMLLKEDKNIQLLESSSKSIPLHFAAKHGEKTKKPFFKWTLDISFV